MTALPTIIVVHPKENPLKCSLDPLRGRPDLDFYRFVEPGLETARRGRGWSRRSRELPPFVPQQVDWAHFVCLGLRGPLLSKADTTLGLVILDGTWRQAERMERALGSAPFRSLPDAATAYPRISKTFADPDRGLASVEALYLAYAILGRDTSGLLDHYRWAGEFLAKNAAIWKRLETREKNESSALNPRM